MYNDVEWNEERVVLINLSYYANSGKTREIQSK
jgi:hypothetical protein